MNIGAVVVTYNRINLLKENLKGLCNQSLKLSEILIVDNFSDDETNTELIKMEFTDCGEFDKLCHKAWQGLNAYYYRNSTNAGGAGGFHIGMKIAVDLGWDYVWIMDDDVKPEYNCLEELVKAQDSNHLITVPCRTDEKNQDFAVTELDMNNPFKISWGKRLKNKRSQDITDYEDVVTMPFEGPLISIKLVNKIGLPKKEFFIFYDDVEYSIRALKVTKIRYVKNSVLHRMNIGMMTAFVPWRAYYMYRNNISLDRMHGNNFAVRNIRPFLYFVKIFGGLFVNKRLKYIKLVVCAFIDGYSLKLGKRDINI
jgi:GT2 family glycosyltransferase